MYMRITAIIFISLLLVVAGVTGADRERDENITKKPSVSKTAKVTKTTQSAKTEQPASKIQSKPQTEPDDQIIIPTPPTQAVSNTSRAGEEVHWQVLASGGGMQTIGSLILGSTIGQSFVGTSTDGATTINSGFWQNWSTSDYCCYIRGDVNYSGDGPDISDIVYLSNYMFVGGPVPVCNGNCDINGSGDGPDISDIVYLSNYMFMGGPLPIPCP